MRIRATTCFWRFSWNGVDRLSARVVRERVVDGQREQRLLFAERLLDALQQRSVGLLNRVLGNLRVFPLRKNCGAFALQFLALLDVGTGALDDQLREDAGSRRGSPLLPRGSFRAARSSPVLPLVAPAVLELLLQLPEVPLERVNSERLPEVVRLIPREQLNDVPEVIQLVVDRRRGEKEDLLVLRDVEESSVARRLDLPLASDLTRRQRLRISALRHADRDSGSCGPRR